MTLYNCCRLINLHQSQVTVHSVCSKMCSDNNTKVKQKDIVQLNQSYLSIHFNNFEKRTFIEANIGQLHIHRFWYFFLPDLVFNVNNLHKLLNLLIFAAQKSESANFSQIKIFKSRLRLLKLTVYQCLRGSVLLNSVYVAKR